MQFVLEMLGYPPKPLFLISLLIHFVSESSLFLKPFTDRLLTLSCSFCCP